MQLMALESPVLITKMNSNFPTSLLNHDIKDWAEI